MFCFLKQKTAYEMRISDWSSDVCFSDLRGAAGELPGHDERAGDGEQAADFEQRFGEDDRVEGEDGDHGADRDIFAAVAASDPVVEGSGAALDLGERQRGERRVAALPQAMQVFVVGHAADPSGAKRRANFALQRCIFVATISVEPPVIAPLSAPATHSG